MGALKEWLYQIIFYLCLMTVVLQIIPETGLKKYVRFFLGLLFILVAVQPAAKLLKTDFDRSLSQISRQAEEIMQAEEKEALGNLWDISRDEAGE